MRKKKLQPLTSSSKTTCFIYLVCDPWSDLSPAPSRHTRTLTHSLFSTFKSTWQMLFKFCWLRPQLLKMNRVNITSSCICIRVGKTFAVTRVVECVQTCVCVCVRGSDGSRAAAGHRSPETFISHYTERRRDGWRGWRRGREGGEEETWRTDQKDWEEGRQRGKQRRRENSRGCLEVRKRRPRRRVRRLSLPRGLRADVGSDFGRGVYWDAPTLTSCVCACARVRVCVHTPVSRCTNTTVL